jgi:hypothetical protein
MCQDSRETADMLDFLVLSRPTEDKLIELLEKKSDKAITMLADKSDKVIEVMKEAGKNFGGMTKEFGGAAKEFGGAASGMTKEFGGAAKELKDIFFIVKCVIGLSAIGAGIYGIHWAWRR